MNIPEPTELQRLTIKTILNAILQVLNLEKGMGYTIKTLIVRPAEAIREFLFKDRTRLTKPFQLIVLLVAVATFLTLRYLPETAILTEELKNDPSWNNMPAQVQEMLLWFALNLRQYFNIFYISSLPLISLATYWIFRTSRLNFAEHLVINTFIFSIHTLIYILTIVFIFRYAWVGVLQSLLVFGYSIFAYRKIFEEPLGRTFLKTIAIYFITQLLTMMVLALVGLVVFLFK